MPLWHAIDRFPVDCTRPQTGISRPAESLVTKPGVFACSFGGDLRDVGSCPGLS